MVALQVSNADHDRVSKAIAAAEAGSDGEIVAVITDLSDSYHDAALHWAVLAMVAVLVWATACPSCLQRVHEAIFASWGQEPSLRELLGLLTFLAVLKFVVVLMILKYMPLRLILTPGSTKTRRVRRRAISIFKAGAERRTIGRTGILIYLSMGEHRAEIVADEAILKVTTPETWGEAMAALLIEVKAGRAADGMIAAIEQVGVVLAEHFPRSSTDTNEIPDKLIEL